MAQILTRDQVIGIIGSALSKVWDSTGKLVGKVYPQYLKEYKSEHARLIVRPVAYFTQIPQKDPGSPIEYDDFKIGDSITIDPDSFALGFRATREAIDDMAKNPFGDFSSADLTSFSKITKSFRNAVEQTKDLLAAQVILQGNSATAASNWQGAGWDGKALYATDHPILSNQSILGTLTYSNLPTAGSLSQANLGLMYTGFEIMPTLEGQIRQLPTNFKLVVGPTNRLTAYTVVETTKMNRLVGSFDHDVPGLAQFDTKVIVNPFLGGSSTRYAGFTEGAEVGYWNAREPKLDDMPDFETLGHKWNIFFRYKVLFTDSYGTSLNLGA